MNYKIRYDVTKQLAVDIQRTISGDYLFIEPFLDSLKYSDLPADILAENDGTLDEHEFFEDYITNLCEELGLNWDGFGSGKDSVHYMITVDSKIKGTNLAKKIQKKLEEVFQIRVPIGEWFDEFK